ncbi:SDR family oxidoreductase [Bdellovibrio sp. HCB290]|uniref:SDR family oxidoreductase n=1 Tax=Bdellovibrio sp. HCB290 TaxID=3394356 RepID=UPI0039B52A4C
MSSWDLQGKTAVVCGASQGIGFATAKLLAERGARVIALARNEDNLKSLIASLSKGPHKYFAVDLADTESLKKILPSLAQEQIHILVNNAGGPKGGPLLEASIEEFEAPLRAHLVAAHLLVQTVVPSMKASKYGRIVNIISTSVKNPIPGLGVSNTIRGAMANWSKTLAGELGPYGITVNNMLPGYIRTGRIESLMGSAAQKSGSTVDQVEEQWIKTIPAGRIGDPAEAAEGIAFLVSPAASYINGINLPVDGGRTPSL